MREPPMSSKPTKYRGERWSFACSMAVRCGLPPHDIFDASKDKASARNLWPDVYAAFKLGRKYERKEGKR